MQYFSEHQADLRSLRFMGKYSSLSIARHINILNNSEHSWRYSGHIGLAAPPHLPRNRLSSLGRTVTPNRRLGFIDHVIDLWAPPRSSSTTVSCRTKVGRLGELKDTRTPEMHGDFRAKPPPPCLICQVRGERQSREICIVKNFVSQAKGSADADTCEIRDNVLPDGWRGARTEQEEEKSRVFAGGLKPGQVYHPLPMKI